MLALLERALVIRQKVLGPEQWYSMVARIACNSSDDGFAGSTKRGTKSPAAFTLARALGRYRLVDRVANHDAVAQDFMPCPKIFGAPANGLRGGFAAHLGDIALVRICLQVAAAALNAN